MTEGAIAIGAEERPLEVAVVLHSHGDFLWRTLQRLGVADSDLSDVLQEVLIVLHRKLVSFDPERPIEPWMFAICAKTASTYRRRAHRRKEVVTDPAAEAFAARVAETTSPETEAVRSEARSELVAVLDSLDPERRALLVMFEIEQLSCDRIAETTGIPVGTVFSRLVAARKQFAQIVARRQRNQGEPR